MVSPLDDMHLKAMSALGYTSFPGIELVPTDPRAQHPSAADKHHQLRRSSKCHCSAPASDHWCRYMEHMNDFWTREEEYNKKLVKPDTAHPEQSQLYKINTRRPDPLPDRRDVSRQVPAHGVPSKRTLQGLATKLKRVDEANGFHWSQENQHGLESDRKTRIKHEDTDDLALPSQTCPPNRVHSQSRVREDTPDLLIGQDFRGSDPIEANNNDPYDDSSNQDDSASDANGPSFLGEGPPSDDDPSEDEDSGICQCPINLQCPTRANNHIDCRTLVLEREWKQWTDGVAREEIDIAVIPKTAEFITEARIRDILRFCDIFHERLPGAGIHQSNFWNMVRWATEVRTKSITQEVLDSTNVLQRLKTFLGNPVNSLEHDQKKTPLNLREDIKYIQSKWNRGDLLVDANRGLRLVGNTSGTGARLRIDENWEHRIHDNFYGHGHLFNGQRWNTRIELSRDGGHGPLIAGIAGSIKHGARSVVMGYHNDPAKEYYANVDMDDRIYYMGTALPRESDDISATNLKDTAVSRRAPQEQDLQPTTHTRMLLRSIQTQVPVRVFRSYKLVGIVKHKPVEGYRYDGLYRVVRFRLLKAERQIYRFTMKRLRHSDPDSGGQGPLRGIRRSAGT